MAEKIIFFDTTLRDGEQASGFHMLYSEKLALAEQLAKLGVDVIEAGFPISSPGDYRSVNRIAKTIGNQDSPVICALSRAVPEDIDKAASAVSPAKRKRIHTFIATSQIHIDGKFKRTRKWVLDTAVRAVKRAKKYCSDVEFSCEDFGRSDISYTIDVVCAAIKAGATTVNLPDTVGFMLPHEAYNRVKRTIREVRERGYNAIFSVHNHNDFGLATATTIESLRAGARQIEVTINGIGERAGNTALEEIVAILKTRKKRGFDFKFNLDPRLIGETSRLVSEITGVLPQPNKAIVGRNAFSHEAGIHQDGVKKDRKTYETMDPADYGVESLITFGPRSGRNALRAKYLELGIEFDDNTFQRTVKRFTRISDDVKETDDAHLIFAMTGDRSMPIYYKLLSYTPIHSNGLYGAVVELDSHEKIIKHYAEGDGLIDAIVNAIREMIGRDDRVADFRSISGGSGSDAPAKTRMLLTKNGWQTKGYSAHNDTVTSAAEAYLQGVNRMEYIERNFP